MEDCIYERISTDISDTDMFRFTCLHAAVGENEVGGASFSLLPIGCYRRKICGSYGAGRPFMMEESAKRRVVLSQLPISCRNELVSDCMFYQRVVVPGMSWPSCLCLYVPV